MQLRPLLPLLSIASSWPKLRAPRNHLCSIHSHVVALQRIMDALVAEIGEARADIATLTAHVASLASVVEILKDKVTSMVDRSVAIDIMAETMRDLRAQNSALAAVMTETMTDYREARSLIHDFQDRLRDRSRSRRRAR